MIGNLFPLPVAGPEGFPLALGVVGNHPVGRVQDGLGGAVILFQPDDLGVGEGLFKAHNILNGGPPELVNALVVVPHHTEVAPLLCQQPHKQVLGVVGILIFVHHEIAEFVLVKLQHLRALLEQLHSFENQIVKIHGVGVPQALLIEGIGLGNLGKPEIQARLSGEFLRGNQGILGPGNLSQHRLYRQHLLLNAQGFQALLHAGIVGVVNGEVAGIPQTVPVPAENPGAGGVEGRGPDVLPLLAQHGAETVFQLSGGLIGKGNGQNPPRGAGAYRQMAALLFGDGGPLLQISPAGSLLFFPAALIEPGAFISVSPADQAGNAIHQHSGFPAAGAGQNQQGAVHMENRLLLAVVHPGKLLFHDFPAQLQERFFLTHDTKILSVSIRKSRVYCTLFPGKWQGRLTFVTQEAIVLFINLSLPGTGNLFHP